MSKFTCRHCSQSLDNEILDLGHQPPSNAYLNQNELFKPEICLPLKVYICTKCWLMQIPKYADAIELFTKDYSYTSSTSISWVKHAKDYVDKVEKILNLNKSSLVIEIASNDGYLLDFVNKKKIPCIGIEPTELVANISIKKGINTIQKFFGEELAVNMRQNIEICKKGADLIIANNVLAHVPDINDFIQGIRKLLKKSGRVTIEFPHLLNLIIYNQFDTIYHEHYSYLSLNFIKRICRKYHLDVFNVEEFNTHGGSLRVWICHKDQYSITENVDKIIQKEIKANLENIETYKNLQSKALEAKISLLEYLLKKKKSGETSIAYGAAAKGNTLLNYSGVKTDLLDYVIDKSPSKQNKFLPGSHIPIVNQEILDSINVESIVVLPWNIIEEIYDQFDGKYDLVTFIPKYSIKNKIIK